MKFRDMAPSDTSFVINSWVLALRSSGIYRNAPERRLVPRISTMINEYLKHYKVMIACEDMDENRILGWICYRENGILFAYVRFPERRKGVFNFMLDATSLNREGVEFVFPTHAAMRQADKRRWVYMPYGILWKD